MGGARGRDDVVVSGEDVTPALRCRLSYRARTTINDLSVSLGGETPPRERPNPVRGDARVTARALREYTYSARSRARPSVRPSVRPARAAESRLTEFSRESRKRHACPRAARAYTPDEGARTYTPSTDGRAGEEDEGRGDREGAAVA